MTARRLGIHATLGHAIVKELDVGSVRLRNASVLTVSLGKFGAAGILGYDFFVGHIVHIDYGHERVELLDRGAFTIPASADTLEAWCGEGLPLIPASIGNMAGQRFALDTASTELLLPLYLSEHDGISLSKLITSVPYRQETINFLEGPVVVGLTNLKTFTIGTFTFKEYPVMIERANAGDTIEIPFDGIIGVRFLTHFNWWFDYDGNRVWFEPSGAPSF